MYSEHQDRRYSDRDHSDDRSRSRIKPDDPPNSRLFIMCSKSMTEQHFRDAFSCFGSIEEIWVLKDRVTQENKGIAYIKYSKTSEAALAMEEMNGKTVPGDPRPLKVLIAHTKDQGSRRESNEEERLLRLFVMVPRRMTEPELRDEFSKYGDIDYVTIVKDHDTRESKGFAYIKYHRVSHAAKAFESCDQSYKPVFAEPKPSKYSHDSGMGGGHGGPGSTTSVSTVGSSYGGVHLAGDGQCRLHVAASPGVSQHQLWRLFDLVPGLDLCEQQRSSSGRRDSRSMENLFLVQFNNLQSAVYAKEKLHGFEYPPGSRLVVRHEVQPDSRSGGYRGVVAAPPLPLPSSKGSIDIAQLTETIANATALLKAAGYPSGGEPQGQPLCTAKLPPPQPLADPDSHVAERLFIVCTPQPPPTAVLKDVFCRFGNLIEVYIIGRKTCGYAKYSDKESANRALETLHGLEVCGSSLKVILAEPQEAARKRMKLDGSGH